MTREVNQMIQSQDDDINLFELFETLWKWKYTLFFIVVISFFIGLYFTINQPNKFKVSSGLRYGNETLFFKYSSIIDILNEDPSLTGVEVSKYEVNSKNIFNMFIAEFQDYEEMVIILKKNNFVKELIKDLEESDKKKQLISLARSFGILRNSGNDKERILSFTWHNDEEGKRLFNDAILLTLKNVKKTLINDLNLLSEMIGEKNKRKIEKINDQINTSKSFIELEIKKRMQFLNEHYTIAKEMNIERNTNFPVNIVTGGFKNTPYYLRGYQAIKKEMDIINSRSIQEQLLTSLHYTELKHQLLEMQNYRSSNQLKIIANEMKDHTPDKWVNFNLDLADTKSQKRYYTYIILSVILGLMLGLIYILTYTSINKRKTYLEKS